MDPRMEPAQEPAAPARRPIRSFVRREGRLTAAQAWALEHLWPRYGLMPDPVSNPGPDQSPAAPRPSDFDPRPAFPRNQPLYLEIGFGNGETLAALAARHPERNYLGIEVHGPGVGHLLRLLEQQRLDNVRVLQQDAMPVLARLPDACLAGMLLLFPDPWPKKRHHKRRLVNPDFLVQVTRLLQPGGTLHLATDWADYAQWMLTQCEACPGLRNAQGPGHFQPRPDWRPLTKFERRGLWLEHGVWDLCYRTPGPGAQEPYRGRDHPPG